MESGRVDLVKAGSPEAGEAVATLLRAAATRKEQRA
jgi:hypothetical protein